MADHDWKEAAALAIAEKRAALVKDIASAEKAAERAVAKASGLKTDLEALDTSVRVLGIDLIDSYMPGSDEETSDQGAPLVKEIVLQALEERYPLPMRAAEVKIAIEKEIGRAVHDKTPGMTLYRLSKEKLVHRQGRDWFFVPQRGAEPEVTSGLTVSEADIRAARYQEMLEDPGEQAPDDGPDWEDYR